MYLVSDISEQFPTSGLMTGETELIESAMRAKTVPPLPTRRAPAFAGTRDQEPHARVVQMHGGPGSGGGGGRATGPRTSKTALSVSECARSSASGGNDGGLFRQGQD